MIFKPGDKVKRKPESCYSIFRDREHAVYTVIKYIIDNDELFLKEFPRDSWDGHRFYLITRGKQKPTWL